MIVHDELLTSAFQVCLVSGLVAILAWVIQYSEYEDWKNWRNQLGRTHLYFAALIAGLFVPTILSLFFHLNRLDSAIAGWVDVFLIFLVTPVFVSRIVLYARMHRVRKQEEREAASRPAGLEQRDGEPGSGGAD